ncbi:hypothetical protein FNV43_RR05695 [Rhamnella rubrinervis]|uniref:Cysteine proteinase inhibitor n=1 Tax=Rhamnella rubrinervis TaxID=2594499 RepID=A0A8K0HM21_9ROSA|nr:hypothetical protein FNV43_RR05695 [Rhamnella rubrinervis]
MATMHMSGVITEVKDAQNSNEIKELTSFAVDEHNKKENAQLKFMKVVSAQQQLVAGIKYYTTLEAADGDLLKVYEAEIWVKPWENLRNCWNPNSQLL